MKEEKSPYMVATNWGYTHVDTTCSAIYPTSPTISDLLPKYTAKVEIGGWIIMLRDKTFTPEQIEHIKEYFGFEVENICE